MHLLHGLDWTTVSWQHSQQTEAPGVSRQTWRADFSASDMWHVYHIQWIKANCKHIAEVFYKISTSPQGGNTKLLRTRLGSVRFAVLTSLNIQGSLRGGPGKTKTGKSLTQWQLLSPLLWIALTLENEFRAQPRLMFDNSFETSTAKSIWLSVSIWNNLSWKRFLGSCGDSTKKYQTLVSKTYQLLIMNG